MQIGIVGGAGHIGFPLGLVLTDYGDEVVLIDKNKSRLEEIASGQSPYRESGASELLETALANDQLKTTMELEVVSDLDVIIFVIGTPIDEHHNPQMGNLLDTVEEVSKILQKGQLLVFRSTVYPGTTSIVRDILEDAGYVVGEDIYLSFAPERVAQHKALEEIVDLPQLIGAFDNQSYDQTAALFDFMEGDHLRLNPTEAELGKLFTNMWRYLTFAAANEFYLITESFARHHDVNVHRILDKAKYNYPRFEVPTPGANVGGPCLTKDGWFLTDNIPYNELVSASRQINEGMPAQIIQRMSREEPDPDKIAVLGMTFKKNSDDPRNSVSFKMKKQLRIKGFQNVITVDPHLESHESMSAIEDSDWVILMTPHDEFQNLSEIHEIVNNDDCLYCDLWGAWENSRYVSNNGYFKVGEIDSL